MAWSLKKKKADYLENSITEGVIWKTLLSFFFPILLGTFFQQMYNTVDAIIVGKFVGKEALASVGGTTGSIINLIVGFFTGLASGATVILSQYYGGRKYKEVGQTVHTAFAMAIAYDERYSYGEIRTCGLYPKRRRIGHMERVHKNRACSVG